MFDEDRTPGLSEAMNEVWADIKRGRIVLDTINQMTFFLEICDLQIMDNQ